jgi:hypothetical protein
LDPLLLKLARAAHRRVGVEILRRKKRTNEQEYVRHLLFTVLSSATLERVLRQLRKLPWPASQSYVLKCVLKVCKGKYAQLALAASLVAGLARYHSAAGVALVDLLLEELRVGMEEHGSPIFGSQRRVAQLRLLGELKNYGLVDHKVRVCACVCVCVRRSPLALRLWSSTCANPHTYSLTRTEFACVCASERVRSECGGCAWLAHDEDEDGSKSKAMQLSEA